MHAQYKIIKIVCINVYKINMQYVGNEILNHQLPEVIYLHLYLLYKNSSPFFNCLKNIIIFKQK